MLTEQCVSSSLMLEGHDQCKRSYEGKDIDLARVRKFAILVDFFGDLPMVGCPCWRAKTIGWHGVDPAPSLDLSL